MSCCLFLCTSFYIWAQTEKPPNIIFLLTDDQRWDALGYAGNEIIQTPEMDLLAKEGVYFENAFVTTPICAASRASIISGQYERQHDYTFQKPPISVEQIQRSYFHLIKEAGFYTGFLGKLGLRLEQRLDTALFDVYQPEYTNFYWRFDAKSDGHIHLTDLMGRRAVDFINNVPADRPFVLNLSYNAPHAEDRSPDQYIWPRAVDTLYQDIQIPLPPNAEDAHFEEQPDFVKTGFNRVRWYWRYDTQDKYQHSVKGYYRMITAIDRTIGQIRVALEEKGLADNTIIILLGDNGYFLGERQFAGKWLMYDNALRVPLIIYDPRRAQHHDINELALNIDIAPTMLDFLNIPIPESMQGKSLLPFLKGAAPTNWRQQFLCEHLWDFEHIPASEGIRNQEWKYFRYVDHPDHEELYHLASDPLELQNLAGLPAYLEIQKTLKQDLERLISESKQ